MRIKLSEDTAKLVDVISRLTKVEDEARDQQVLVGDLAQQSLRRQRTESLEARSANCDGEVAPDTKTVESAEVTAAIEEAMRKAANETDAFIDQTVSELRREIEAGTAELQAIKADVSAASATCATLSSNLIAVQSQLVSECFQKTDLDIVETNFKDEASELAKKLTTVEANLRDELSVVANSVREQAVTVTSRLSCIESGLSAVQVSVVEAGGDGKTIAESEFSTWAAQQTTRMDTIASQLTVIKNDMTTSIKATETQVDQRLQSTESRMIEQCSGQVAEVDARITTVITESQNIQREMAALQSRLDDSDAAVCGQREQLSSVMERLAVLDQGKVSVNQHELWASQHQSSIKQLQSHLDAAAQSLDEKIAEVEVRMSSQCAVHSSTNSDTVGKITDLTSRLDENAERLNAFSIKQAGCDKSIQALDSKLMELSLALDQEFKDHLPMLQNQVSEIVVKVNQHDADFSSKLASLDSKQEVISDGLSATDEIVGQINTKLKALTDKHDGACSLLTTLDTKIAQMEAGFSAAKLDGVQHLQQQIEQLEIGMSKRSV
eukprot:SAG31_NODE_298_length_18125_cov_27.373350_11_plen_553_part_00